MIITYILITIDDCKKKKKIQVYHSQAKYCRLGCGKDYVSKNFPFGKQLSF